MTVHLSLLRQVSQPSSTFTEEGCSTAVSVKPVEGTHSQLPIAQTKNDIKKALKQERTVQNVQWLENELKNRPGYNEFCATLNHVKDNPGAVRSWNFAVDFMRAYHKMHLIVSLIMSF